MRICLLNWKDTEHPGAGGAEVYTREVIRHLVRGGDEVVWFAARPDGQPARADIAGAEVVRAGGRLTVYREARRWWRREGRRRGFDVVVDEINTRPFLAPRWADVPVVALVHQTAAEVWDAELGRVLGALGRRVLEPRWLAAYADVPTITVSSSSRRSLEDAGLRQVHTLPQGTDLLPAPDLRLAPARHGPTLVWCGRLAANKRPGAALDAYELLRRQLPGVRLWVLGDGPLRPDIERRAAALGGVDVLGHVPAARRNAALAAADLLITTSVREGWGLNVSEAALLGTPTVGYSVPGLVDSVPASGGALCDPDPRALATTVGRALRGELALKPRPSTVPWAEVAVAVRGVLAAHVGVSAPVPVVGER